MDVKIKCVNILVGRLYTLILALQLLSMSITYTIESLHSKFQIPHSFWVRSFQIIGWSQKCCLTFYNIIYGKELLTTQSLPSWMLPLSVVHGCLITTSIATFHTGQPSPPSAGWERAMLWWQMTHLPLSQMFRKQAEKIGLKAWERKNVILQEVHCKIKDERNGSGIRNLKVIFCTWTRNCVLTLQRIWPFIELSETAPGPSHLSVRFQD